jgi:tRNA A-37 threonylcarbamoyl transferase component Bud32/TolB-like protein/tetratricopeptide (TPR) repeat protein
MEHEERLKAALADRYRIRGEIGRGGMATVYLAQDLKHERQVAIKVLRSDLAASLGAERFLQEVRVTANLTHPHILPLHDSGEADGFLFYVMPFIEGESLRDRLVRERELPVTEAARILRDVVDALAAAHKLGVVHRDIKPENVLISGRHAMVADFGVAKAVSEATGRHKLTTMGVALGTPSYMAPEQAAADHSIDHRADIYAVGAMAYELLTGRPPFTAGTPQQVLAAQVMETPQPVTELRASVPPALETLIMKCLEKKPADRWQSAEEMLPHLEAATTPSGGLTPTDIKPVTGPSTPARRRSVAWMMGAGAVVVAAILTLWALGQRPGGTPEDASGLGGVAAESDSLRVVVLPFENRSGRPEDDLLGSMVSDWTARILDQVETLTLVPSAVVQDILRGIEDPSALPTLDLARRTGARYAVVGNFVRMQDDIRFEAELLDVRTGELRRTLTPARGPVDSLELVVEEGAKAFAAGTVAILAPGATSFGGRSLPPNLEAYQAWAAGEDAFCEPNYTAAAEAYYRASSLAPSWTTPLMALLPTLNNLGRYEERDSVMRLLEPLVPDMTPRQRYVWIWNTAPTEYEKFQAAEELYERYGAHGYMLAFRAIRINRLDRARDGVMAINFESPCAWPANWVLAAQVLHLLGEDEAALARIQHGRKRFPGPRFLLPEARIQAALGDLERVRLLADTLKNSPTNPSTILSRLMEVGLELRTHGHRDASVEHLEDALAWADGHPEASIFQRGRLLYYLERYEEALPIFEGLAAENRIGQNLGYLALTLEGLGQPERADSIMAGLEASFPTSRYPALLAARRGDAQKAVASLRGNFDAGMYYYAYNQVNLHRDPDLEPIRDDPLFQALMRPRG